MFDTKELTSLALFVDSCNVTYEAMIKAPGLEIYFNDAATGGYLVFNSNGDPLGRVEITDAGAFEFVPDTTVKMP